MRPVLRIYPSGPIWNVNENARRAEWKLPFLRLFHNGIETCRNITSQQTKTNFGKVEWNTHTYQKEKLYYAECLTHRINGLFRLCRNDLKLAGPRDLICVDSKKWLDVDNIICESQWSDVDFTMLYIIWEFRHSQLTNSAKDMEL